MFPPMPQFQGRQVVTLHNQRDFLFFRRHRLVSRPPSRSWNEADPAVIRYAFRSTEKAALQEIGPRFTLKLKSLRIGLPAVKEIGEHSTKLEFDEFDDMAVDGGQAEGESPDRPLAEKLDKDGEGEDDGHGDSQTKPTQKAKPPTVDEYQWQWKVSDPRSCHVWQCIDETAQPQLETTRRTFFL